VNEGAPTLGEIARVVYAIQQDVRAFRTEHVRADVYGVANAALIERVARLERDLAATASARAADRRIFVGAAVAAVLSLAVQLIQSQL
jgi:hypothetical protein